MRLSRLLPLFALVLAIAGCAGDGVRREINPPRASLQELAVQADGRWRLSVRLQNFSNVATNFVDVDAALDVGGQAAGAVRAQPGLVVGPNSADVINLDAVYDAASLSVNTMTGLFFEEGVLLAQTCFKAKQVTVNVKSSGVTGAASNAGPFNLVP